MSVRICVATSYTADFGDIGDYAAMTLRLYAARHGLSASVSTEVALDRPPSWHRVKLIPQLFDQGHDYVLWLDADALFCRFDVDIHSVINGVTDLYMVRHDNPSHSTSFVPNTGVMLVRNSKWSRDLFATLWSMEAYLNHGWWENAAMIKLMGYHSLLGDGPDEPNHALLARIAFLSTDWNYIPSICAGGDPIIKHYAGFSNDIRRREMPKEALKACFRVIGEAPPNTAPQLPRRFFPALAPSLGRGLNASPDDKFKVYTAGQKRRIMPKFRLRP